MTHKSYNIFATYTFQIIYEKTIEKVPNIKLQQACEKKYIYLNLKMIYNVVSNILIHRLKLLFLYVLIFVILIHLDLQFKAVFICLWSSTILKEIIFSSANNFFLDLQMYFYHYNFNRCGGGPPRPQHLCSGIQCCLEELRAVVSIACNPYTQILRLMSQYAALHLHFRMQSSFLKQ